MQNKNKRMEFATSEKKVVIEDELSVNDLQNFDCFEYVNNSFSWTPISKLSNL